MTVDDGLMSGWKRVLAWASAITGGLALIGLGVYFVVIGLDRANKLAGVTGVFAALIGLGLSVYGVVLTRRGLTQPVGQTVANSTVGGEVLMARGVQGNLRVGPGAAGPAPAPASSPPSAAPLTVSGGQSVIGTQTAGSVRQFDDIGGDADIDR
jgi:hypothetical protein